MAQTFQEVRNSTGLVARAIVENYSDYVSQEGKHFPKIELYIKELGIIKVSIPLDFDKSKYVVGELVTLPLKTSMKDGKYTFQVTV